MSGVDFAVSHYAYYLVAVLLGIGLYGIMGKQNLLKRVIGMTIFQTSIYLFFIQGAAKDGGTLPVFDPDLGTDAATYMNPLPHIVVLTAIVVGVAITGVALALLLSAYRSYGSLDEPTVFERMREEDRMAAEAGAGPAGGARESEGVGGAGPDSGGGR